MTSNTLQPRNLVLILLIVLIAALRVASFSGIGPLTMFTPVGAMALFAGAHFKGYIKPLLFPLLTLFVSDLIVSFTIFPELRTGLLYAGWQWTYLAFVLIVLAGKFIIKRVAITSVLTAVVVAMFIHWIVSDIGMCVQENNFTLSLYIEKLVSAIPFELRFLQGTAIFSALIFGAFELLQKKFPSLHFNIAK